MRQILPLFLLVTAAGASAQPRPASPADTAGPGAVVDAVPMELRGHFAAMVATGPDAEAGYQRSIAGLRASPRAAAVAERQLVALGAREPFVRWQMIQTLRDLGATRSVPTLARVAMTPLPARRFEEDGSFDNEMVVRMAATDAIASFAKAGAPAADAQLLALVRSSEISVRRRAIRGYLAAGSDQDVRRRRLVALVAPRERDLITLDATRVQAVPAPQVSTVVVKPTSRKRPPTPAPRANPSVTGAPQ